MKIGRLLMGYTALAVTCKVALFVLDHSPRFVIDDSIVFLRAALTGAIPPDRSFIYGFLLRPLAVWPKSLLTVIVFQSAAGLLAGLLLGYVLIRFFGASPDNAGLLVVLFALDPLQLLFERYVLTESLCLLLLAIYMTLLFHYLDTPRWWLLPLSQAVGVGVIAMRLVTLPLIGVTALLAPFLAFWASGAAEPLAGAPGASRWTRLLVHFLLVVTSLGLFQSSYRHLNGIGSNRPPTYNDTDGLSLLAAWSPIVKPDDAPDQASRSALEASRGQARPIPPANRNEERWGSNGLVSQILKRTRSSEEANRVARQMALSAAIRDPIGLLKLAWSTYMGYWHSNWYDWTISYEVHTVVPQDFASTLRQHFSLEAANLPRAPTLSERYYRLSRPYYLFLVLSPLLALLALGVAINPLRPSLFLVLISVVTLLGLVSFTATYSGFRYLHHLSWFVLLLCGVLTSEVWRKLRRA